MSEARFSPQEVISRDTEQRTVLPDLASLRPGEKKEFWYNNALFSIELSQDSVAVDAFFAGQDRACTRHYIVGLRDHDVIDVALVCDQTKRWSDFPDMPLVLSSVSRAPNDMIALQLGDGNIDIVSGLGRIITFRAWDDIGRIVQSARQPIVHKVQHNAWMGLTPKKWDEIFVPELERRGYTKKEQGLWFKIYEPKEV